MQLIDFLVNVNGIAQLFGGDGQFLGVLSSNTYEANSILNQYGFYGGQYGVFSISNPYGLYGGQWGVYSPYNPYCTYPPVIIYGNNPVIIVTRNPYVQTNGLPIIDPDLLLGVYAQLTQSPTNVNLVQAHLQALTQARKSSAEAINRAMQISASMFR
ncbi:hypothetical protein QUB80_07025 [Chlorogloeopsis sp. ULAP01]|uniref:hypothetical protein n=1 Tax=Chlorogloeopsis sp. ULAP01 TaxID=3056483 RepID=UPI0025AAA1AD|nr:hypothetical protein [Chlorogloeopsis sp. ULAP01]MDM9380454.1 hypothetical protein [Chlorogloeopsis sp. ULAP01]